MANKKDSSANIQQLASFLFEGDRKKALSHIRNRLNQPFNESVSQYQEIVWRGWERALNRQESDSLIFQLLNGLPEEEANKNFKDMKKKKTEILIRDHTQIDLSKIYLGNWVTLLEYYCTLYK